MNHIFYTGVASNVGVANCAMSARGGTRRGTLQDQGLAAVQTVAAHEDQVRTNTKVLKQNLIMFSLVSVQGCSKWPSSAILRRKWSKDIKSTKLTTKRTTPEWQRCQNGPAAQPGGSPLRLQFIKLKLCFFNFLNSNAIFVSMPTHRPR